MKKLIIALLLIQTSLLAQNNVSITVNGFTPTVSQAMKKNTDRISWYYMEGSKKVVSNVSIELLNDGVKSVDRGRFALEANPDEAGNYQFDAKFDVKIKKTDITKPVTIRIVVETTLGNQVFTDIKREPSKINEPIQLDGYMWRAGNNKIKPERRLCLEFSAFINDPILKKKVSDNEGFNKFNISDFQVFLKQSEKDEWKILPEPIKGGITNGTAVNMTNILPNWIDPSKKLYVRFSVKTPKGNFIWDEYSVEPNEYRKEQRARNYNAVAFDKTALVK